MVTEREARDMQTAIEAFQVIDSQAAQAQFQANLAIGRTWFDANVTLTWNARLTLRQQFSATLADITTIETLTETEQFRVTAINEKIREFRERIRTIKAGL